MKRKLLPIVAALAIVPLGASIASAGEITGNGRLKAVNGRSICAYSGLNDAITEDEPHRTQSFGTLVKDVARAGMVSSFAHEGIGGRDGTHGVGIPGNSCNPNGGGEG